MVKADTFWVPEKNKVYLETKTIYEKTLSIKAFFFNIKDFIFYSHIC